MRKTIVVAAALALVGCTSSGAEPDPATTSSPPAAADTETATIGQWASLVAPLAREWRDQVAAVEDDCGDVDTLLACELGYLTLSSQAERYVVVIDAAQNNRQHDDYLGEPPAEIAQLVEETVDAASAVEPAVTAYSETGCGDPRSLECGATESLAMDQAVGDLTAAFDAWAPYM